MVLGIDASRAFLPNRTGIEEYSYQVIKHLREVIPQETQVVLYTRPGQKADFPVPKNWILKPLWAPRLWTQFRLSLEMLISRPDVLFVPAHIVPLIHPRKTWVTIHGLEYEFCKSGYSLYERLYMRSSIWYAAMMSEGVIAVSENTKKDLNRLYRIAPEKIHVIPEGFDASLMKNGDSASQVRKQNFLFIGRLEARKNIVRIIEAFEIFKKRTGLPHQLILAGKPGYGYGRIAEKLKESPYREEIETPGYVNEGEKQRLFQEASVFIFPSLYEGFGLPVLEAQAAGLPVITSTTSSLPEVAGQGALLVDPADTEALTKSMEKLVQEPRVRADIIEKASQNVKKFSWMICAQGIARLLQ